uniref:Uncharacterized protein n=1 Tax=Caenorhabditis japonica TaxID=281687 RepID=A0A8R1EM36_CAEJA
MERSERYFVFSSGWAEPIREERKTFANRIESHQSEAPRIGRTVVADTDESSQNSGRGLERRGVGREEALAVAAAGGGGGRFFVFASLRALSC